MQREQRKVEILQQNIKHIESQVTPLNSENVSLKDHILATNFYIQQRCVDFQKLVKNTNQQGQTRELLKRLADLVTLYKLLDEDINEY